MVIDNFSKFGLTIPSKNENAQTIKDSFEIILASSKTKPKVIETDPGKDVHSIFFPKFKSYQQHWTLF